MQPLMDYPFPLDPFQEEAIRHVLADSSVLVSAPTGAGKTVIAECVIRHARRQGLGVIYTAPVKALSNQKYRDFKELYPGDVGIVTGDVSIQPEAPIVIMTTEIYRNSLFENSERIQKTGWVIFDEIHYLNDPERGTVWEEAILFTPENIRLLALSATVPNIAELAEWMRQVHGHPIQVITETHRPVPLKFTFQCQGQFFDEPKDLKRWGYGGREQWENPRHRHHRSMPVKIKPNRLDQLLEVLRRKEQLPCIYFVFGRKRAESLAAEAMLFNFLTPEERRDILALYDRLLERYGLLEEQSAHEMRPLIELGIGFHHAGMLPSLKEVVEQIFTSRLLKLIFTTETFALGINMPARCVVFDELQKFYGNGFKNLTTRDFYQMAGRAGRRGMDDSGFVTMRVNPNHIAYPEVLRVVFGEPEPILSQFNAAYATLLNLFRSMGFGLLDVYPRSLHCFQSSRKKQKEARHLLERKIALLRDMGYLTEAGLTEKGEFAASLFGYEFLLAEMHEGGVLSTLDPVHLCVLLSSFVFEPRKDDSEPRLSPHTRKLSRLAEEYHHAIYRKEVKYRIYPLTKAPHFHLAPAIEAWARGLEFDKLFRLTGADEGELIRNFRMVIQLLRELYHAAHTPPPLASTAQRALTLINRDIVDAEKQLRA